MKTNRYLLRAAVAASSCLISFYSAQAARIWNMLDQPIMVVGGDVQPVTVGAGKEGPSIEWSGALGTQAYLTLGTQPQLCDVQFGFHHQMVGGNYLVVSAVQDHISCVVCDAGHNVVASASGQMPPRPAGQKPYTSSHQGC